MKFVLSIESGNDALTGESAELELADILTAVANELQGGFTGEAVGRVLRDSNGARVGTWTYVPNDSDGE